MKIPILDTLIQFASELGGKYMKRKLVEAEGRILVATTRAKADATVLITRAENIAAWEQIQAKNSGSSWKDEFWTLLIALPIPFVFWPVTRPWVTDGFEALHNVPDWYLWAIAASISASFGIRSGLFERITGKFTPKPKGGTT